MKSNRVVRMELKKNAKLTDSALQGKGNRGRVS